VVDRRSLLVAATLLVAVVLGCWETRDAAATEKAVHAAVAITASSERDLASLDAVIARLNAALDSRPDDAEAHGHAAELWIARYRLEAREQLRREYGDRVDERTMELLTSLGQLHRRAHEFAQQENDEAIQQLRSAPAVRTNLVPAWYHLAVARAAGPTLPWTHLAMAELRFLVEDPARDAKDVDRGVQMAPGDANLLYRGGEIEWHAGRISRACAYWRRSLELTTRHQTRVLDAVSTQLSFAEVVEKVLPESADYLLRLIRTRYASEAQAEERGMLADQAAQFIDGAGLPEYESHYLRGAIDAARGRLPEAVASYERALELRPGETQWRYELALLYTRQDMLDEAQAQARMCARVEPERADYRALLKQIYRAKFSQ
jgi:tetratricopeptide (TPR) repeat protein